MKRHLKLNRNYNTALFIFSLIFILLSSLEIFSQNMNKLSSFEGRNFYVAFMQNEIIYTTREQEPNALELFISSSQNAKVNLKFQGVNKTVFVAANSVEKVIYGREVVQTRSELVNNLSIHITSDVPITIYGINSIPASSDMFSAIPTMNWGTEYVVMSYPNDTYKDPNEIEPSIPRKSQFCVIASEDNTTVTITPSAVTAENKPAGSPFNVVLNKGQCYLVQSSNVKQGGDLTGSNVKADKPIGVISGHVRTALLQDLAPLYDTKDHLVEMMTPINSWGNNFITVPFLLSNNKLDGNLYRVVAKNPGTSLTVISTNKDTLKYVLNDKFSFIEIPTINYPATWQSSGPIQIMQYMKHTGVNDNANFDPSMSLVPPNEQFVNKILIQVPDNSSILHVNNQYEVHRASIIMEKSAYSTFQVDNVFLKDILTLNVTEIPGTNYYWVRIPLGTGSHLFTSSTGYFSGILYGYGKNDSYSVIMGSSLLPIGINDAKPPIVKIDTICGKVSGYAYEARDLINNSGIDYIYVNSNTTKNFNCIIGDITDTSTYVSIEANIIDDSQIGELEIIGRDRAGNEFTFYYKFYPIIAKFSNGHILNDNVTWHGTKCQENLWIENESKVPLTIYSIYSDDLKVKVSPSFSLPYILKPDEKFYYSICAMPNGSLTDINSNITIQYQCNKSYSYNWKLKVTACELYSEDTLDFKTVYLNNTNCKSLMFNNSGNEDIIINSIRPKNQISNVFDFNSKNAFPIIIKPGENYKFEVCFTPIDNNEYYEEYDILYNCDAPLKISFIGKGISSELNNLSYDFGKVLLNNTKNHHLVLKNTGNIPAPVKFAGIIEDSPDFYGTNLSNLDITIMPNESINIPISFKPLSIGKKYLKANFTVNLDKLYIYTIELFGEGISAEPNVINTNIGRIYVNTVKDSIIPIVYNIGDYHCKITNITVDSGDVSQFTFDFSNLLTNPITLYTNDTLKLPIRFNPSYADTHSLKLRVHYEIPDSDINENLSIPFYINASSIAKDTISIQNTLDVFENRDNCNEIVIEASLKNKGKIDATINDISILGEENFNGKFENFPNMPIILQPGEKIEFKYVFINSKAKAGPFTVKYRINDTLYYEATYNFTPPELTKDLILIKNDNFKYTAGDTITLNFSGKFPHKTATTINSYLRIKTNPQIIRLIEGEYQLEITNNLNNIQKKLDLFQKFDYFDIPLIETQNIDGDNVHWNISLKFATYFKKERVNPISISFISDDCFNSVTDSIISEMLAVCLQPQRDIILVSVPEMKIFFDNSINSLEIDFENYISGQKLFTEIYDINAKLVRTFENDVNELGPVKISLDLSEIPNGVYLYQIRGTFINEKNKFIK